MPIETRSQRNKRLKQEESKPSPKVKSKPLPKVKSKSSSDPKVSDPKVSPPNLTYSDIEYYLSNKGNRSDAIIQTKDMTGVKGSYDLYKETRGLDATSQCWHVKQLSEKKSFKKLHLKAFQNLSKKKGEKECDDCWKEIETFMESNMMTQISCQRWDTGGKKHLPSNDTCGKSTSKCAQCYICQFKITKEGGTDAIRNPTGGQCEHIIPVASLSTLSPLPKNDYINILSDLIKSNPTIVEPSDKLVELKKVIIARTKILLLLFDWAHPKCNIVKSDYPFIDIKYSNIAGFYLVVNKKTIKYILCEIFKEPRDFKYLDEQVEKGKFKNKKLTDAKEKPSSLLLLNQGWEKERPGFSIDKEKRAEQLNACYELITRRLDQVCDYINSMDDKKTLHYYSLQIIQSCINKKCQLFKWKQQTGSGIQTFRSCFGFYYKTKLARAVFHIRPLPGKTSGGSSSSKSCKELCNESTDYMNVTEEILDDEIDGNVDKFNVLGEHIERVLEQRELIARENKRLNGDVYLEKDLYEDLIEQIYDPFLKDSCCSSETKFTEDEFIDLCLFYLDYLKGDKSFNSEEIIEKIDKDKLFIKEYENPVLRKDPKKKEKMKNSLLEDLKLQATTSRKGEDFKQSIDRVEDLKTLEELDDYLSDKELSKTVRGAFERKKVSLSRLSTIQESQGGGGILDNIKKSVEHLFNILKGSFKKSIEDNYTMQTYVNALNIIKKEEYIDTLDTLDNKSSRFPFLQYFEYTGLPVIASGLAAGLAYYTMMSETAGGKSKKNNKRTKRLKNNNKRTKRLNNNNKRSKRLNNNKRTKRRTKKKI